MVSGAVRKVEGLAARVTPDSCRDAVPGRDWFGTLAEWSVLGSDAVSELRESPVSIRRDQFAPELFLR